MTVLYGLTEVLLHALMRQSVFPNVIWPCALKTEGGRTRSVLVHGPLPSHGLVVDNSKSNMTPQPHTIIMHRHTKHYKRKYIKKHPATF